MATKKYDDLPKETLIRLLEARDRDRATRFGLVWEHDEIERDKALNGDFVALDLDPSLSCGDAPWKHLIIEGDNFDALRYLKMTFAGRVKCIYIDPPYNTGNKDFVYNDRYVDKEDLWRHSKWCEFLFQRLTLAKDLLAQDGVIFVSIDDNELHHLELLMTRIYGEGNWIGTIIWHNVTDNNPTRISVEHEYIVCFALSLQGTQKVWKGNSFPIKERLIKLGEEMKATYPDLEDRQAAYTKWFREHREFMWPFDRYKYIDDGGIYTGSQSVHNPGKEGFRYDIPHPVTGKPCKEPLMGYRFAPETMKEMLAAGKILFGEDHTKIIEIKLYVHEYKAKLSSVIELDTRLGANELRDIFKEVGDSKKIFAFPKPSELIKELISFAADPEAMILDFFAGSGTTAHAVHKLNKEDGGNRRVILVSSIEATVDEPDKNLCRDVCATRVRRVIEGYGDTPGLGGDFAYLRCRRIPPGKLLDIDHAQVWTALQLTHMPTIAPFDEAQPFAVADDGDQRLIYIPHFRPRNGTALVKLVAESPAVIVYTWQKDMVRDRLQDAENVQVESIPESLAKRFGLRV